MKQEREKAKGLFRDEDLEVSDQIDIELPDVGGIEIPDVDLDAFMFDPEERADTENRYVKPRLVPMKQDQVVYDNAVELARECKVDHGERLDAIISGSFIFGDFIEALLTTHNIRAERMVITTLSLSQENVDSLYNLMTHGYIGELDMVVSTYFYNNYRRDIIPYLYEKLDMEDRYQLAVADVHTKTVHFRTTGGRKIVIHGSANLRSNGAIEQFTIEENPELHDFYEDRFGRIIEKFYTIQKPVRGQGLWKELAKFKPR